MSKYCIDVEFLYHTSIEIDAETEERAMEIYGKQRHCRIGNT